MSDHGRNQRAADPRSTSELITLALTIDDDDDHAYWEAIAPLHARGGAEELAAGLRLCQSAAPNERRLGVHILAQLGWNERAFLDESVAALIERLGDADEAVVAAAGIALSHRADARAIPHLIRLKNHPNVAVRYGVIFGLLTQDDPAAIAALIELSADDDDHNRDWATFALGTQIDADTSELRAALLARLDDSNPEVRGEAMIGLARRGDRRVVPAIQRELRGEFTGIWPVEAAELIADPSLRPHLRALAKRISPQDRGSYRDSFAAAVDACAPPAKGSKISGEG
jgi:HEAT repeat protein